MRIGTLTTASFSRAVPHAVEAIRPEAFNMPHTALVCLVRNALEAAANDGWARVRVEPAAERLRVVVEDSGPGPAPTVSLAPYSGGRRNASDFDGTVSHSTPSYFSMGAARGAFGSGLSQSIVTTACSTLGRRAAPLSRTSSKRLKRKRLSS